MSVSWACSRGNLAGERLQLSECRLPRYPGIVNCGVLKVEEHRLAPNGRKLSLRVVVIPALTPNPEPDPFVILVGGPGQAATVAGAMVALALEPIRKKREIVLIDQRGTGQSGPLTCAYERQPFEASFSSEPSQSEVNTCLQSLAADTTQYATPNAIADLEAVRQSLGYTQWNLWGGSYGTRVALAYVQQHPEVIRRVVLDGVAPTDIKLPLHMAADGDESLRMTFERCEREVDCRTKFPDLRAQFEQLLSTFDAGIVDIRTRHPATGERVTISMSRDGFLGGVRTLLYSAELSSVLPLALHEAHRNGDWAPYFAALHTIVYEMSEQPSHVGMYLSVICAEDTNRIDPSEIERATKGTYVGDRFVRQTRLYCDVWNAAALPATYFDPVVTNAPVLLLSGQLDPATPPRWGQIVESRLPHALHVVVPGVGHGVSTVGCAPQLITRFLDDPEPTQLDVSCLTSHQAPASFTRFTGP
jgi:pimeloyl-ACP methyl ester carboxylesterase